MMRLLCPPSVSGFCLIFFVNRNLVVVVGIRVGINALSSVEQGGEHEMELKE